MMHAQPRKPGRGRPPAQSANPHARELYPPHVREMKRRELEANIARALQGEVMPLEVPMTVYDLKELPGYVKPRKQKPKKEQPMNSNHATAVADLQPGPGRETTEILNNAASRQFQEARKQPADPLAPVIVAQGKSARRGPTPVYTEAEARQWYAEYQETKSVAVVAAAHGLRPDSLGKLFKRHGLKTERGGGPKPKAKPVPTTAVAPPVREMAVILAQPLVPASPAPPPTSGDRDDLAILARVLAHPKARVTGKVKFEIEIEFGGEDK